MGGTLRVWALAGALGLATTGALALGGCSRNDVPARASDANASSGSRAYADAPMATSSSTGSARETPERASYGSRAESYGGSSYATREPRAPVPMFDGEPMWSDSRQHTAQENAQYHCGKSGGDIGASSLNDCLKKVHAFLDHPPGDVEKIKRSSNGDTLFYDPKDNLFAVARRDGAPRTFFKPRDGAQYWKQQQEREASGGQGYGRRSGGGSGASDEG